MASQFQAMSPLGAGAYGAVYEAIDLRTGQRVAVKELDDTSAASIVRFKAEFRVLAGVHHPNLVGLRELIEDQGRWAIVMELVPGSDLISFVRGRADNDNQRYDEARLRSALLGMARGLVALHGFGLLHRDLKPSNVRVTPEGRAVLLDFGLATHIDPQQQSTHGAVLGTVAYMAPEQATSANVDPSADWYAFGVCLFEALTGKLPFEGETVYQVLQAKQTRDAPRASSMQEDVPADLDELCARLLARDPAQRAGAREVFAVVAGPESEESARALHAPAPAPFAGRAAELLQLERAFSRVEAGVLRFVLVEGESGVGKSELVAEFVRRMRQREPELLALSGRCYESEQIAYKALDGCIDELARFLERLPERVSAALLPPRAGLLTQLFPTLRGVRAIRRAPVAELSADPTARRLEAFAALAGLLRRIAQERSVMLVIDDLQWADAESFRLLSALLDSPESLPILIVATVRPPEELDAEARAGLDALQRKRRLEVISVLGLPAPEAADLARTLLGPSAPEAYCQLIAAESRGHPLFLSELVQYARSHDLESRGALTLEAALSARIRRLPSEARALLEVVALAGRPYSAPIFARALGVDDIEEAARALLSGKLLRLRGHQELGVYHDGIRRAAVAITARSLVGSLHRQLAVALSSDAHADAYAYEQAQHWDLAGDSDRAADAYVRAIDAALSALAFSRAAELCERAMRLIHGERSERENRLLATQAHALACAGRSAEAAACYERATLQAEGQEKLELRARHAQQLLVSGDLERGFAKMRALLADLDVRLPTGTLAILARITLDRLWLALFGRSLVATREEQPTDAESAFKARVIVTFSNAISPLHPLAMMLIVLRAARLSYKLPIPSFRVQLYTALGWVRMLSGSSAAAQVLFDRAHQLAHRVESDDAIATALLAEGSAVQLSWDFPRSATLLERAHHILQTRCPDQPWMLRVVRYHLGLAWYALGRHRQIALESERWLLEARERNDHLTVALLLGMGNGFLRHLMRDEADEALRELDLAMRAVPREPYSFLHVGAFFARAVSLLYKGGPDAHEWLSAREAEGPRPFLMRSPGVEQTVQILTGQAALHAYESAGTGQRSALLARVTKEARRLLRRRSSIARAHGHMLRAQVHALTGHAVEALTDARAARAAMSADKEVFTEKLTCYLEARLESSDHADARCRAVVTYLHEEGWQSPLSFLKAMLPAIDRPSTQVVPTQRGLLLERFEVVRPLGGGGFGSVVEVREVQSGRTLAVKELISAHPRSLERFKQEFRLLRGLHHPNLVQLEGLHEHEGRWYIAMELIEGKELIAYCRPNGQLDRGRLCRAFVGLCDGLAALHAAGFAHRDVCPENVCVSESGRAVLLDFGLVGRLGAAQDSDPLGSFEYSAPEQLDGAAPSAAADVYALGTCLYEALSGSPPFAAETPALVHAQKRAGRPPPLPGAGDFERLALEMLDPDPDARPALQAVRARLEGVDGLGGITWHAPGVVPFAGREEELTRLHDAFERSDDRLTLVLIEGESGLGKSALMAELVRVLEARMPGLLALTSRCYESEQLALKAFDGAVDQLARTLRAFPPAACDALLPKRAALLAQLFPVLASVPAIAHASKRALPADPGARKRAATECFVELLAKLSESTELLLAIDDLQWADGESLRLLHHLCERGKALPFLVVCTVRPSSEVAPELASELAALRAREGVEVITLGGLSPTAANRLVEALSAGVGDPEQVARLVREAKGHPLFLRELVEQAREGAASEGALSLDIALRRRIESFDATARSLLSLAALAGKPYRAHVLARALQRRPGLREAVVALLGRGLLRSSGSDALTVYHDRIARAALEVLLPEETRALAGALAASLELEPDSEASERARLWDAAEESARACATYVEAGDHALEALQFVSAARHYQRAVELVPDGEDARRRTIRTRRGDALARAGHCAEAARTYQSAAEGAEGELAARLRTRAAEQAIQSGQAEWGLTTAGALLEELDLAVPIGRPKEAFARLAWNRAALILRPRSSSRRAKPASVRVRMQLDAAWALAQPLSWLDPLASAALTTHHLRIALASGEPVHTTRALAAEAFAYAVHARAAERCDALMARARALASKLHDPALEAEVDYRAGMIASYRWDLKSAHELLERALSTVSERCPDQPWLTTNIRVALGSVLFSRSEHAQLARISQAWLTDARDRGDQLAVTNVYMLGHGFLVGLMANEPDQVLARLEEERRLWPDRPFAFIHFGDFLATSYALLYRTGPDAWRWFEREHPRLRSAELLRFGTGRALFVCLRAVAALAAWAEADGAEARALLGSAHALVRELSSLRSARDAQFAPYLRAQLEAITGDRERALSTAREVAAAAERTGHVLHVHRAQYLAAALEGGSRGDETRAGLRAHYAQRGWMRPERNLTLLCPTLAKIV